jgi:hypothetical protein
MGHPMKRKSVKPPRVRSNYRHPNEGIPVLPATHMLSADLAKEEADKKCFCWYCGVETIPAGKIKGLIGGWRASGEPHPSNMRTKDHVVPRSRGGKGKACVKIVSCAGCNSRKGASTLDEFRTVEGSEEGFFYERRGWALPVPV